MAELNVANRTLFHGDNLEFLRAINSESIHLIATDPPFNKNKDFHATPDSLAKGASFQDRWRWDTDVHEEWVDLIHDNWPKVGAVIEAARITYGDDMGAFLCWLGVRLLEMHRILRPDGSIYLHIDHTAHAYVKALMDGIFGGATFRNELVWLSSTSKKGDSKRFGRTHEIILAYSKGISPIWNSVYIPYKEGYLDNAYNKDDLDGRGPYMVDNLTQSGLSRGESGLPWRGIDISSKGKHWVTPVGKGFGDWIVANVIPHFRDIQGTIARLDALDEYGLIYWPPKGNMPRLKRYRAAASGEVASDMILDIAPLQGASKERTGYPTQKPLALYERIIKASSNPGDMVLDPFCGCATTPVAAERLGRQWIGMDIWEGTHQIILDRLSKEGLAIPDNQAQLGQQMLTFGQINYCTQPPVRTDDNTIPVPDLKLKIQRPKEGWELLTHRQIRDILIRAQTIDGLIGCPGCGRRLEVEFTHLDHRLPKSENGPDYLTNRILLCGPCNSKKAIGSQ